MGEDPTELIEVYPMRPTLRSYEITLYLLKRKLS